MTRWLWLFLFVSGCCSTPNAINLDYKSDARYEAIMVLRGSSPLQILIRDCRSHELFAIPHDEFVAFVESLGRCT